MENKENAEKNLGGSAILALTECHRKNTDSTIFFDNFFTYWKVLWQVCLHSWNSLRNRKTMPKMTANESLMRDDHEFLFCKKLGCCKWIYNWLVTMLFSNVEEMTTPSTVLRCQKELASKVQIPYPNVLKI